MATIRDFAKLILGVEGVTNYILVRNDGNVVIHNVENPDALSSMIAFSGLSGDALTPLMGTSRFRYLVMTRADRGKLMIFRIRNYFLGVVQHPEAYTPDVTRNILRIVQAVVS